MSSPCKHSFYPVGLPKLDSRTCVIRTVPVKGRRSTLIRFTDGTDGVHARDLNGRTEVKVRTDHGEFRATIDPENYRGNADKPVDLFALAEYQGLRAARACALASFEALRSQVSNPDHAVALAERRAELTAAALAMTATNRKSFQATLDALCDAVPNLRVTFTLACELFSHGPPPMVAVEDAAALACAATGVGSEFEPAVATMLVAHLLVHGHLSRDFTDELPAPLSYVAAASPDNFARIAAARDRELPLALMVRLTRDRDTVVRIAAVSDPRHSPELLTELAGSEDRSVQDQVALNPSAPPHVVEQLSHRCPHLAARNPNLPLSRLAELIESHPASAVRSPNATATQLERALDNIYVRHLRTGAMLEVVGHPNVDAGLLGYIYEFTGSGGEYELLIRLAEHTSTPSVVLAELVESPDHLVRERALANPGTPAELLAGFDANSHWEEAQTVASNPSTPQATLVALARHNDWTVRSAVSQNTSTPDHVLTVLCDDHNCEVFNNARQTRARRSAHTG